MRPAVPGRNRGPRGRHAADSGPHSRGTLWAAVPELGGRYLRVVTLEDRTTIHNAFPDRGFIP